MHSNNRNFLPHTLFQWFTSKGFGVRLADNYGRYCNFWHQQFEARTVVMFEEAETQM
jgi:hypothetical protein